MRKSLSSLLGGIVVSSFLTGCASSREITSLDGVLSAEEYSARQEHHCVDSLRKFYYVPEAYDFIKDVPVIDGLSFGNAYAAGTTFLSSVASFFTFNGLGRKVILSVGRLQKAGIESIIHEDVHHFDDLGHDGGVVFIDHCEFLAAYERLKSDAKYASMVSWIEYRRDELAWFTDSFGVCEVGEDIAYVACYIATHPDSPEYMRRVFDKVLRRESYPTE